jgi:hypothetical protein
MCSSTWRLRLVLGNTRLALHTATHDESDLLAAYNLAQSLPSHAFSLSMALAPALESFLEILHSALCVHAETTPDPALQYAVNISRFSLVLRPADLDTRFDFLNARALTLEDWFHDCNDERSSTGLGVLMEAVVVRRRLLTMTTSDDQQREQRSSLASLLWDYWKCNGESDVDVLQEEIDLRREILQAHGDHDSERATACDLLTTSLYALYEFSGDLMLFHEALELEREVLRLRPEGHPDRAASCAKLASSLRTRFNQTGDTLLLDEALELQREALRLRPEGHPDRAASCANLGNSLWTRFNQTGDTLLLDEALELHREALRLTPEGHPDRAASCANLGTSLWTRFNQTGDIPLLDEALELQREALRLRPEGHPLRVHSCGNLALSLRTRFNQTGDPLLLDEARLLCTLTTKDSAVSSSEHVRLKMQLALIYTLPAYAGSSPTAAVSLLMEALQHRVGLIQYFYHINAVLRQCFRAVASHEDHVQLLTIYRAMIEVLPELGSLVLDQTSRLERWRDAGSLPLQALLLALKANDLPLGLQLLEQGRAVLWSQILAMQDPQIEKLPDAWKHQLKTLLRSMSSSTDRIHIPRPDLTARDWAHLSYTRLQQLLKEIRASSGLERFMRGPSYSELVHVASVHPVVFLAMEETACHAVILSSASASPVHLTLDSITASELEKLGDDIRSLDLNVRAKSDLTGATGERGMNSTGKRESPAVRKLHQALERLWFGIVKPIFDRLGFEVRELS